MMEGPFLVAVIPGLFIILLTWWFRKRKLSLFVRLLPSIMAICASFVSFYYGYVEVRGFEGAAYGFLAFFLLCYSVVGYLIATINPRLKNHR
ncbi:YesK family protein [Peribacillus deserti]|nr:YesK family protein [Peribacillus deserti]